MKIFPKPVELSKKVTDNTLLSIVCQVGFSQIYTVDSVRIQHDKKSDEVRMFVIQTGKCRICGIIVYYPV